jgi:hypothetical protein
MHLWQERIDEIIVGNPTWSEIEVTWKVFEEIGVEGAKLLLPVYERERGKKGRLSIQTNPAFYRNAEAIVKQAVHFHTLAPNIQMKIPVTKAGLQAIEEATYQGVIIYATVCFSVPQSRPEVVYSSPPAPRQPVTASASCRPRQTGGGGYNIDVVPRSWALAWGVMSGQGSPAGAPAFVPGEVRRVAIKR